MCKGKDEKGLVLAYRLARSEERVSMAGLVGIVCVCWDVPVCCFIGCLLGVVSLFWN